MKGMKGSTGASHKFLPYGTGPLKLIVNKTSTRNVIKGASFSCVSACEPVILSVEFIKFAADSSERRTPSTGQTVMQDDRIGGSCLHVRIAGVNKCVREEEEEEGREKTHFSNLNHGPGARDWFEVRSPLRGPPQCKHTGGNLFY